MDKLDELIDTLAQDATTVKLAPPPSRLCLYWLGGAVMYLAVALRISGLRPDWLQKLHEPWFVAEGVALCGILFSTSLSAAWLSFPDRHQRHRPLYPPVVSLMIFVVVLISAWYTDTPPAPLPHHRTECTVSITLLALIPTLLLFVTSRQLASTHPRWTGSMVMLSAFSLGALWLRLYEPNDSILHVIQWHYLPMIGVSVVGSWLGKIVLRW